MNPTRKDCECILYALHTHTHTHTRTCVPCMGVVIYAQLTGNRGCIEIAINTNTQHTCALILSDDVAVR